VLLGFGWYCASSGGPSPGSGADYKGESIRKQSNQHVPSLSLLISVAPDTCKLHAVSFVQQVPGVRWEKWIDGIMEAQAKVFSQDFHFDFPADR
jgi:hypothetical protein